MTGGCNQTDQRHTSVSPWLDRELALEAHTDLVGYLIYKGANVNALTTSRPRSAALGIG